MVHPAKSGKVPVSAVGRTGYCLAHYGCGDSLFNSLDYEVCVMAWREERSLHDAWACWKSKLTPDRVVHHTATVGEDFYWTQDPNQQYLTFRRGLFTVSISAGLAWIPIRDDLLTIPGFEARLRKQWPYVSE